MSFGVGEDLDREASEPTLHFIHFGGKIVTEVTWFFLSLLASSVLLYAKSISLRQMRRVADIPRGLPTAIGTSDPVLSRLCPIPYHNHHTLYARSVADVCFSGTLISGELWRCMPQLRQRQNRSCRHRGMVSLRGKLLQTQPFNCRRIKLANALQQKYHTDLRNKQYLSR